MSYSTCNSTFTERKSNRQKPCKVLLICVYETIIFELTNQLIFDKFSPYGSIIKILIFEKGEVTKFFIEYNQTEQATNAKTALDGSKFFENICKMNIYFSNFNNVDLKHQSTQGADYEILQERKNRFIESFDNLTKSSQQQNIDFLDDQILMQTFSAFGNSNTFARSKTDNPKSLESQILKMQKQEKVYMIEEEDIDRSIKKQIHTLLSEGDFKDTHSEWSKNNTKISPRKQISVNLKQELCGSGNLHTVLFYDLKQELPLRQIYNLFSNFGNIECIIAKKHKVYIKFRSGYFAAVTMNYLHGMHFCGNYLNLRYCDDSQQYLPKPLQYSESIYFEQSCDRFTPKRSITVNPPSQTLHVSSIKKENCNQNCLRKIFSEYGYVEKVRILMQSNEKNMALVRFSSVKQSFEAISQLHNRQIGGRKLQISFTKSKL